MILDCDGVKKAGRRSIKASRKENPAPTETPKYHDKQSTPGGLQLPPQGFRIGSLLPGF